MPVYAYLAKALGLLLGSWGAGAVVISLVAGYLACLVLYRIVRMRADDDVALWAVVFFACAPLAALFQVGYAESLFLLWLFLSLWFVMRRRYGWLYLLIPLMGFTRPGRARLRAVPRPLRHLALVLPPSRAARRARDRAHRRARPAGGRGRFLVAGHRGGRDRRSRRLPRDRARLAAQLARCDRRGLRALRRLRAGSGVLVRLVGAGAGDRVRRARGIRRRRRGSAALRAAREAAWASRRACGRRATSSTCSRCSSRSRASSACWCRCRPLWGAVAMPRSVWWRIGVLAACLVGQWWWIYNMYALGNTYWQIP